ncbi:MAG: ferrous iron transport protein A [Chloroflexi bacterium]|nr:ferrous iron transport protein A [Chloroflexota bacterium]
MTLFNSYLKGNQIVPLSTLVPGQQGAIVRVGGHPYLRRRLLEMGLVRGETISVERVAPLGDPIEFMVKGYHLSLRRSDAANIEVQLNRGNQQTRSA